MQRIAITRIEYKGQKHIAYIALDENREFVDFQVYEPEETSLIGNIYIGRVEHIVSNINACFVRISPTQRCFLSLEDAKAPFYTKKVSKKPTLTEGDELLVQVTKDAVKTKEPVCSTQLTLQGTYSILTYGKKGIGVSKKIPAETAQVIKEACEAIPNETSDEYGILLRTNAQTVTTEQVVSDITMLMERYHNELVLAKHQKLYQLVSRDMPGYLQKLKRADLSNIDVIYTDQDDIFKEIQSKLNNSQISSLMKRYDDSAISLATLYHIYGNLEQLTKSKVWLPSGANLIIETLETLTVIDVNSAKNMNRKDNIISSINFEAAKEIARQLRLRNISGMIIIDFINMNSEEEKNRLITYLKEQIKNDFVPCNFIDITKLGLVELTRKKTHKSLKEILKSD